MTDAVQTNQQFRLASRPVGLPTKDNWQLAEEPLAPLEEGQVRVKLLYLSLDPAMRGWMNEGKSYIRPVAIGETMRAGAVGRVVESRSKRFAVGEHVSGAFGVQRFWTGPADDKGGLVKIDPALAPLPAWLNVLGMPGMTAYFGLLDIGQPKAGETVLVSAAAGAVGATVGQIAKHLGCRVVGIAGGADKCRFVVEEFGFDACIDYKEGPIGPGLKQHCPDGVDVYFDNVGGEILDAVLTRINMKARIVICGAISQYNNTTKVAGPANYLSLLVNRARMEGMVVFDFAHRYPEGVARLAQWLREGSIKHREHVVEGFENFPAALLMLFEGKNFGKLVLKIADD
ncbi:NADP-dependent oxidoreductase [Massilia sp. WF1]|uniref:NADP-dependent oxidoreductase n=1 Tax=unclassified Massilia TaxID=2609279 RepID=UPI0006494E4C|nr:MULTISPECIES: NADP-dependent oxidoreductase [unclassified Massilia]ALK96557.1 NADP-dependent oxidoreductase [Massilia sp. WG5]KLU36274.1 NADP-dependent oxidoreductase [Massilia sp. WF1]